MSNVFKEASKAETALKNIDKRADKARELLESRWADKRLGYIDNLPLQVRIALREAGVIEREDKSQLGEEESVQLAVAVANQKQPGFFDSAENRAAFNIGLGRLRGRDVHEQGRRDE